MTAVMPSAEVDVLSAEDAQLVVKHTLAELGVTFEELAAQAQTRTFTSIDARLAWLAIGDLYRAA